MTSLLKKQISIVVAFLTLCLATIGQSSRKKIMLVIDSVPQPDKLIDRDNILPEDIADSITIAATNISAIAGYKNADSITYLFTKAFRTRPDSIKTIPGTNQMLRENGKWYLNNQPYTGRYIDYYLNGKVQYDGTMSDGLLHGELKKFYVNGATKFVSNFNNGNLHGIFKEYYSKGALMSIVEFIDGKPKQGGSSYFSNGQLKRERKPAKGTRFDTTFYYNSSGKVQYVSRLKDGLPLITKKEQNFAYYSALFNQHLSDNKIKAAYKDLYELWKLDSKSVDLYFKEGLLLARDYRFEKAIEQFDKVLETEPMMQQALEGRALARIKKHLVDKRARLTNEWPEIPVHLEDIMRLPDDEWVKVQLDVLLADDLDPGNSNRVRLIPRVITNYFRKQQTP